MKCSYEISSTNKELLFRQLGLALVNGFQQMEQAAIEEPWLAILNEKMKKGSELYAKALDASRAAFYVDFMGVMFRESVKNISIFY